MKPPNEDRPFGPSCRPSLTGMNGHSRHHINITLGYQEGGKGRQAHERIVIYEEVVRGRNFMRIFGLSQRTQLLKERNSRGYVGVS